MSAGASEIYYRPYTSDSESDITDSDSEASFETDSTSSSYAERVAAKADAVPRNFRALAEGLSYKGLAGPDITSLSTLIDSQSLPLGFPFGGGRLPTFKEYEVPDDPSGNKLTAADKSVNNIIMLDSRDRDRHIFSQPTDLTLRLPRVYNNITDFQLVQVKLLSAFQYFRDSKHNTDISILELNRTVTSNGTIVPNIVKSFIREGSYDINALLAELTVQLNATPIFYDFPNGFQDFAPQFAATGNFALNFNFPGETYYDSLLDQYIPNPTTALIVSKYFNGQYAGLSSYSTDQIKVAYYYPALKEALLDTNYDQDINLDVPPETAAALLPTETVRSRCIYTFQGLNDVVIQEVIRMNIAVLDDYRTKHTFRYSLINKYVVTYETQSNHVTFSSPGLNTSLSNLITYKQAQYFAEQLSENGITSNQYAQFQTQNTLLLAVLNDMFYYIERWLAVWFGINFNTYTLNYVANPTNLLPIQNAYQGIGISSNFDLQVLSSEVPPIDTSILTPLQQSAKSYWNRLTGLPESTLAYPYNLDTGVPATSSNYVYNTVLNKQLLNQPLVDADDLIYNNKLTKSADIVVPLEATKYTVFRFKSPVRQTLQVETLPRPTQFRYPAYNAIAYDASQQAIFDNSYAFVQNAQNANMDVAANFSTTSMSFIPGYSSIASTANFGLSYASSLALWGSTASIVTVGATRTFFQFQTPYPTDYLSTTSKGYRYPLSLTLDTAFTSTFNTGMSMFFYHDRAAFMADISDNRNEKPVHYLQSTTVSTNASSATITFNVYGNQTYYVLARSQAEVPATQHFRVVPWFPDGSNYTALTDSLVGFDPFADPQSPSALFNFNYASVADPAYIRLPIQSSIQNNSTTTDILYSNIVFSTVAIGYDVSGVSTDLTNYCGFIENVPQSNAVPGATLRLDPTTGYGFQVGFGYNSTTQSYLTPSSSNTILQPQGAGTYTAKTVPARETSIVHWYGTTYIGNSVNQPPMPSSMLADTNVIRPFTPSTTAGALLNGYTYGGSNSTIQFGDGIVGTSFVPQQGVWDIQRVMFKSVYTTSNAATDENLNIKYVGVFPSGVVESKFLHENVLDDAIAVLKFSKAVRYMPSVYQNLGFDAAGGTYYEFERDTTYRTGSNAYLYGYTQIRSTINTDVNAMYSLLAFDVNKANVTFQGLVGSPVPYPFYSDASAALFYSDGSSAPDAKGIIVPKTKGSPDPTRGPPTGYDETQSKYEQSMTIGTNHLQFATPYPFPFASTSMKAWDPLPYNPSLIIGDVSGYFLTQDVYYRVFEYDPIASVNLGLDERYQFTLDQIYPSSNPRINFVGVAANEYEYAFFAYSNLETPSPSTSKLLIRTMRPSDGTVTWTHEYDNLPGFDPTVQQITNMTYNNFGGFALALKQNSTFTVLCKHTSSTSTITFFSTLFPAGYNSNIDHLIVRQSPKEQYGGFYVFPYRTGLFGLTTKGITDFVYVMSSNVTGSHNLNYTYEALVGDQSAWLTSQTPCKIQVFSLSNASPPQIFKQPIIARNPFFEYIFMLSDYDTTHYYSLTTYSASNTAMFTSNANMTKSSYQFPFTVSNFTSGANGAKWSLINSTIFGNRDNFVDGPKTVTTAWQLFYPMQRIVLRQVAKNFTFIHDLSGLQYPEYPHTALIGYNSLSSLTADTSNRWGLESSTNFTVADFSFSGKTFNSFLFTFPLHPTNLSTPYYYLAVRNYTPTEKSQVLMRFSAPNLYDFGYVTMTDLSNEVVISQSSSNMFNPEYYYALNEYNKNFIIDASGKVFGSNIVQGYPGSNISSVVGFGDFYNRFLTIYQQYNSQVQLIQGINSTVNASVSNFIRTDLQYILPASALNRQRFTDPLTFSILWNSALLPQYRALEENWGLGWNLGFKKQDTPYETVHRADSFYKILDDYISLRLNPEFDMNRMDTGAKENLGITLEPTGNVKSVHAKLLLANFGSFAQTIITNPISFTPPLARLDRLRFQWVDATGTVIDNSDCEWNMVVQVAEKKEIVAPVVPMRLNQAARVRQA